MNHSMQICQKAVVVLFASFIIAISACTQSTDLMATSPEETPISLKSAKLITTSYICNPQSASLISSASHVFGIVDMLTTLDTRNIQVTVSVKNGWTIKNIQVFVGILSDLPFDGNGNPQPELFPLNLSFSQNPTVFSYEFKPALSEYQTVAVHAELNKLNKNGRVLQSEEAWISGTRFNTNSWATYYTYRLMPCGAPQP